MGQSSYPRRRNLNLCPMEISVIIRLVERKINHLYLKNIVTVLWKLKENFSFIDLGLEFTYSNFPTKNHKKRSYKSVLSLWLAPIYWSDCGNLIFYPRKFQLNTPQYVSIYPNCQRSTMMALS